jgi:hypothetical protein
MHNVVIDVISEDLKARREEFPVFLPSPVTTFPRGLRHHSQDGGQQILMT